MAQIFYLQISSKPSLDHIYYPSRSCNIATPISVKSVDLNSLPIVSVSLRDANVGLHLAMSVDERDSCYSISTSQGNLDRPLLSFFTIKITKGTALQCLEVILEKVMLPRFRLKPTKLGQEK